MSIGKSKKPLYAMARGKNKEIKKKINKRKKTINGNI